MVDRYIFVKLKPPFATPPGRAAVAAEARALLGPYATVVAGTPADDAAARSWDVSIIVRCPTLVALDAALAQGRGFFVDYLAARAEVVKGWSFAIVPEMV